MNAKLSVSFPWWQQKSFVHTSKFYFDKSPCSETEMLLFNEDFSRKTNLLKCVVTRANKFAKKNLVSKKNRIIRAHELNEFSLTSFLFQNMKWNLLNKEN